MLSNTVDTDSGSSIRNGMKVLHKKGVCTESLYKYDIEKFTLVPKKKAYENALKHKISKYISVGTTINEFKTALGLGHPIIFGFIVKESFEKIDSTGILNDGLDEEEYGGHAVLCCGYDDNYSDTNKGYLKIMNSWGPDWGHNGYFYMSYKFLESGMCSDAWIIIKSNENF